jgi:hypothetical protein
MSKMNRIKGQRFTSTVARLWRDKQMDTDAGSGAVSMGREPAFDPL